MTILIVEDNEDNRRLASKRLRAAGHQLVEAVNAAEARARLKEGRPDLVLLDLQLPGEGGLSLVKDLRRDPSLEGLVVVACTAFAFAQDREDALAAGCDAWLSKPVDIRRLPEQLEAIHAAAAR